MRADFLVLLSFLALSNAAHASAAKSAAERAGDRGG